MKILVTGVAGFIGFHSARRLLARGDEVVGFDNLNNYYDPDLKRARLAILSSEPGFRFALLDVADRAAVTGLFDEAAVRGDPIRRVLHLAAQAGVRGSIDQPHSYVTSNLVGFLHILEECRHRLVEHLVFASSSSVYGANTVLPYSVHHNVDHPLSMYAATKKANELMAHSYSHLFRLPSTGLRFFTAYGPWGRPDMALFRFTQRMLGGQPLDVYNYGNHRRDFTYIDDIVEGVLRVLDRIPEPDAGWQGGHPDPATSLAPYRLYNIGNGNPCELMAMIRQLEQVLDRKAILRMQPMQPGDVPETSANVEDLVRDFGFRPSVSLEEGIPRFVDWYRHYYRV